MKITVRIQVTRGFYNNSGWISLETDFDFIFSWLEKIAEEVFLVEELEVSGEEGINGTREFRIQYRPKGLETIKDFEEKLIVSLRNEKNVYTAYSQIEKVEFENSEWSSFYTALVNSKLNPSTRMEHLVLDED